MKNSLALLSLVATFVAFSLTSAHATEAAKLHVILPIARAHIGPNRLHTMPIPAEKVEQAIAQRMAK